MLTADGPGTSGYAITSGTSDAAAVVSGAAALVRAKFPELSAAQVVERLTSTADDKGPPGRDDAYGYGQLDLMAALSGAPPSRASSHPSTASESPTAEPSNDGRSQVSPIGVVGIGAGLLAATAVVVFVAWRRSNPT
jgi:subtilisin family serine protease